MESKDISKRQQIRNLLLIIGSAVGVSFAAMFFMLYSYGPEGSYLAKNVLLSPENVKALYFSNANPKLISKSHHKSHNNSQFVFDLIEFSYYDFVKNAMKNNEATLKTYGELYTWLGNDISITDVAAETAIATGFNNLGAKLSFKVKTDDNNSSGNVNLFEVDFVKDYYRISLRGQNSVKQWAYFKHIGILEQAIELLATK
ncbi:MAG: hypothetical protein H0X29_00935 [Parachlamydiaceae bacterium]|nr:hypothetical protein [Parachlamydiaceae bacterium]